MNHIRLPRRRKSPDGLLPPGWDPAAYAKAEKRARGLAVYELLDHCDAAGSGMSRGFMDHRRDGDLDSLAEIETALMVLWAVTQELRLRAQAAM
jgi:hypothetical protein